MVKTVKKARPKIPVPTQMKLWLASGGICQLPGCNKFVFKDSLTFAEGNYSNIAHIIAYSPDWIRGDVKLSPLLATEFSNLMLMCTKHAKMIDIKKHAATYTVEYLRKIKKEHETRIKIQTSIAPEKKTTVLRIQTNIRDRKVEVTEQETYTALIAAERYPENTEGVLVDLTNIPYSTEDSYWKTAAKQIDTEIDLAFRTKNNGDKIKHLSVFGIAPIPILAHLGFKIGNTIDADIYIKPREKQWHIGSSSPKITFQLKKPRGITPSNVVALSIAISGTPTQEEITTHVGNKVPIYQITSTQPGIDQVECIEDLEAFRKIYRKTVDEIRETHGSKTTIHLFGAIPTCVAVICGRELLHKEDPSILLYERLSQMEGYIPTLTIN